MNGYLAAMGRYASFSGRASRAEYWWFTLIATLMILVVLVVDAGFVSGPESQIQLLTKAAMLLHALPGLAITVRRLHDTDRSGWMILVRVIPPIGTIVMIVLTLQAGTSGPNRFGHDPYGAQPSPVGFAPPSLTHAAPRDMIAEIERLAQLRASGSLSEVEFEVLKAQALAQGVRA